tara:strand:+ start:381 stop:665 length:285 start_codon:yes stop_codon:yes gene_type:complete
VYTLTACSIKNKIWNSTGSQLGVTKQSIQPPLVDTTSVPTVHQQTSQMQPISVNKTSPQKKSFELKWYYVLPFVGLVILGFLVYRLKQQNLKSL